MEARWRRCFQPKVVRLGCSRRRKPDLESTTTKAVDHFPMIDGVNTVFMHRTFEWEVSDRFSISTSADERWG